MQGRWIANRLLCTTPHRLLKLPEERCLPHQVESMLALALRVTNPQSLNLRSRSERAPLCTWVASVAFRPSPANSQAFPSVQ